MALQRDTQFQGIQVPSAYCTVGSLCFPADSKTEIAFILYYRANDSVDVSFLEEHYAAPYNLEGADPYKQAYEYLKNLSAFEGCTDC